MMKSIFFKTGSIILFSISMLFFYSFSLTELKDKPPTATPTFFSKIIQQFNTDVKQSVKKKILSTDLPQRNYFVQDKVNQLKSIKPDFELPAFMMTGSCPDVEVIDLRNVAGFPQIEDLTVCGAADTLAFMLFTGDPGEIKGFQLRLELPDGIEYAGWEFTQLGNTSISVTKPKPNKPEFFIDGITGDSLVIANIGIRANCEVDKSKMLFFDFNYEYTFIDTNGVAHSCEGTFTPEVEYNSAIHMPVLNMLSPLVPAEATLGSLSNPYCQTIEISQDGLNSYVDSFTFEILNLALDGDLQLISIEVNEMLVPAGDILYDAGTMTTTLNVDGTYFPANSFNNPTDNQFNTNELLEIEVCYQTDVCPSSADLPFRYNAKFGCDDEICDDSGQNSFIRIRPTGAMLPLATASLNTEGIEICGNPGEVSITVSNPNTNTAQNVYTDLQLGFQTCNKPNLEVAGVTVGGITIPDTFYTWVGDDINIDLRTNLDETIGLIDHDKDGFFDDLPGGSSLTAVVLIEVSCGLNPEECAVIDCQDVQFYVDAKFNCGNSFKDFPVPDAFDLLYGPTSVSNPTEAEFGSTGVFGYDFGTYSDNTDTISTDSSALEVEFCYTFDKLNIEDCPSGADNFLRVDFNGAPRFIKDLEYSANSSSWSIDSGATYTPISDALVTFTKADDENATLILNMGSEDMNVCYKYSVALDTCLCSPVGYFTGSQQVVSSCSDCTDGCEILKACRAATFRADPNCKDCDCIVEQGVHSSERTNFGYTDKTATTKHTKESLISAGGSIDLTRFLPGDTLTHYNYYVIKDEIALDNVSRWAFNWYLVGDNEATSSSPDLPLSLDAHNAVLDKFMISKDGVTTRSDIDFGAFSSCLNPEDGTYDTYGSIWNYFNQTPWDDSIGHRKSQNSSNDRVDNSNPAFYIWNYSKIEGCGDNAHLGSGNCFDEMMNAFNLEVGDTIHIQFSAPLIINPYRAAETILGVESDLKNEAKIRSDLTVYQHDPISGSAAYCETNIGSACRELTPIFLDVAGEIDASTRMILDDCGGTIEHTFVVNDLPGPIGDPWFTHEYRPFMDITRVNGLIRAPLAYCANAQVTALGVTYDVSVDSTQNLFCAPVAGFDENICGVDSSETLGNIFFNLTDQGVPALGIGFDNCDTLKLSYDLCMICPQDITGIAEYDLYYDWSYVNTVKERGTNTGFNQYICNISTESQEANSICDELNFAQSSDWYDQLGLDSLSNKTDVLSEVFLLFDNRTPQAPVTINNQGANLLSSDAPGVSEEIQKISIHNTDGSMGATGVGASVKVPAAVKLVDVYTDAAGTMPLTKTLISDDGQYKIYAITLTSDNLAANEKDSIYVGTTLLFCPDPLDPLPKVCVSTFSGCAPDEVKAALGGSGGCANSDVCYAYITGEVGIQSEWFDHPATPALCEEVTFNVRIKNVKELVILDLVPTFNLPPGIEPISGSWEVSYPGGEAAPLNWQPIGSDPDSILGNTYTYSDDAIWSAKINSDGLQGVSAANVTLDSNKVAFRFRATTTCDKFLSGSKFITETSANDPCSDRITTTGTVESPGVIINGANPINFAQLLLISDPEIINCEGNDNTFGITAINTSDKSTSDSVLFCLTIPEQLTYTDGSIMFVSPADFVTGNVIKTTIGTTEEICFNAPAIGAYGSMSINFDAVMDKNAACGDIRIGTDVKSFVDMVACSPGPPDSCGVFVQNSLNASVNVELAPPFIAENLVVFTDCAPSADSVKLYFEYDINHDGTDAVNQAYTVNFYDDIDGSQTLNTNIDELLATTANSFTVNDGASIKISGEVTIAADKSCPVLFEVVYDTDCTCDRTEAYYDNIKFLGLRDYDEPLTMCPGSCIDIEICDFISVGADSIQGATGVEYLVSLDWNGANTYTYPSNGPPSAFITYEDLTDNSIGNGDNNMLIAEQTAGYDDGYIVASYLEPVKVERFYLGGGDITGWGNVIHVYGGTSMKLEYSSDGINWTLAETGLFVPNTPTIKENILATPITAQHFRVSSNSVNRNWATSEFRLEGAGIPFQGMAPVTVAGNIATICIPAEVGIETPWPVTFTTGTGDCAVTETIEIWQSGTPPIEIEGDTVVCGAECITLELIIPNDAKSGMTVAWTPTGLIDDPTDFRVKACGLTADVTFEATITYAEGNCQEVLQFPVKHYPTNSINVVADTIHCYNPLLPPTLTADTGWDTYTWYDVSTGTEILVFNSFSNVFIPTSGGEYLVKANRVGTLCPAISSAVPVATDICPTDLGDLPDSNNGTAMDDYETLVSNNGPSHVIIDDLFLGSTVDAETDGQPDGNAFGDGVDEDGITIFPTLDIVPGNTIMLPLSITNGTGNTAYFEAWIDWNGDGDFNDPNEIVANMDDSASSFPTIWSIAVPSDAKVGSQLGVRLRLSNTDGLTPYGPANSGEIEDFLIGIGCEQIICIPATIEINKDK